MGLGETDSIQNRGGGVSTQLPFSGHTSSGIAEPLPFRSATVDQTGLKHPIPVSTEKRSISRDEMNLAEFPLTVLSTRSNPKIKTLEFSDSVKGKNGELIKRSWVITGADKFGLPTASDDEVLLGLLKLTVDSDLQSCKVFFTRYELLKILRWTTEGRSYLRLQNALDRLSGVRVKATNAFFDNESKSHSTKNFGILDAYEINDGRDTTTKPSFFIWSEEIFKSFQAGFIKKLDLGFYLNLRSAVSKRLYRYLDKHFWYKATVRTNLFTLSHEKVGISRNYKYASSLKQQLDPALQELSEVGFLSDFRYEGKGKHCEVILQAGRGKPRCQSRTDVGVADGSQADSARPGRERSEFDVRASAELVERVSEQGADNCFERVEALLIARGLKQGQVRKLLGDRSPAVLGRVERIVRHFDGLVAANSHLVSRSPIGFLYRAVQYPERFVLPDDKDSEPTRASSDGQKGGFQQSRGDERLAHTSDRKGNRDSSKDLEQSFQRARRLELAELKESVEPALLDSIKTEVRNSLARLEGVVSAERMLEAVSHGVDQKLASLFGLPDFHEWLGLNAMK